MHEAIQAVFEACYGPLEPKVQAAWCVTPEEIYGELYYYSAVKLLQELNIRRDDHFLDIGSGLGKLVYQVFYTTPVRTVTGIEINKNRHEIATGFKERILTQINPCLKKNKNNILERNLHFIHGDMLVTDFQDVTIAYVCATVFSYDLLTRVGQKINSMPSVKTVVSLRKLPDLLRFTLRKKMFLQGSWDTTVCYIYERKK
jgi:SAM-dependent methyltransferase